MWSCDVTWTDQKHYISTIAVPMVTKPVEGVRYRKELQTKSSHSSSMRWCYEVRWQVRYIISSLSENQRHKTMKVTNLQWDFPIIKGRWHFDHVTNTRSRGNLKNLYLQLHKTYGHWTWQGADFEEEVQSPNGQVFSDFDRKKNFVFIVLLAFFNYTLDLIILLIALYIYKLATVHVPLAYMLNAHSRLSTHEPHIYPNICVLIP